MPMVWNDHADARLLVAILSNLPGKLDLAAIAKSMGSDCTVSAIQHRIQRIKEKANSGENGAFAGTVTAAATATEQAATTQASAPSSPEKRKRGRPAGTKRAKKLKAKVEDDGMGEGEGENGNGNGYGEGMTEA